MNYKRRFLYIKINYENTHFRRTGDDCRDGGSPYFKAGKPKVSVDQNPVEERVHQSRDDRNHQRRLYFSYFTE